MICLGAIPSYSKISIVMFRDGVWHYYYPIIDTFVSDDPEEALTLR